MAEFKEYTNVKVQRVLVHKCQSSKSTQMPTFKEYTNANVQRVHKCQSSKSTQL
jgi:hypothetical protein